MVDGAEPEAQGVPLPARRLSNDHLAGSAAAYRFLAEVRVPFWCECGEPSCAVSVPMTLANYRGACATGDVLLAPNHVLLSAKDPS